MERDIAAAQAQITAAADYISTRRGGVGADARTRLSEAERHLGAARQLEPGNPDEAGITLSLIEEFKGKYPILGICLGHQAIGQAFGGKVKRAPRMMHGKLSEITHDGRGVFKGLPKKFSVTRYHSLHVEEKTLPSSLKITAKTDDGLIMGLRHKKYLIEGVQFHPESYLTEHGHRMLKNFLDSAGA
ncbi:MAG: aminodeoxychorismate/anthranilate synthase component II [Oxalobacteraceae bacterium]|nr:MAG: aminodeoxychorismate/anthranilate synthase component II [Oxalobacteraceae bacterium]